MFGITTSVSSKWICRASSIASRKPSSQSPATSTRYGFFHYLANRLTQGWFIFDE